MNENDYNIRKISFNKLSNSNKNRNNSFKKEISEIPKPHHHKILSLKNRDLKIEIFHKENDKDEKKITRKNCSVSNGFPKLYNNSPKNSNININEKSNTEILNTTKSCDLKIKFNSFSKISPTNSPKTYLSRNQTINYLYQSDPLLIPEEDKIFDLF